VKNRNKQTNKKTEKNRIRRGGSKKQTNIETQ